MATVWNIKGSTHGMSCAGCAKAASSAIGIAKATGSTGATHSDNGNHVAKVSREVEK